MKNKNIETRKKTINCVMNKGGKKTSEKVILKTIKNLQKNSKKQMKELIQLAIINSIPIFKLHKIENKKQKKRNRKIREVPAFISKQSSRISSSIKFILYSIEKKSNKKFYKKLNLKLLLTAENKGNAIDLKNSLQKQVILKKHLFNYYRWK